MLVRQECELPTVLVTFVECGREAARARKALGAHPQSLRATAQKLVAACKFNLAPGHRPQGASSGKAVWRRSPARKFNWWFGSTLDLQWLLGCSK